MAASRTFVVMVALTAGGLLLGACTVTPPAFPFCDNMPQLQSAANFGNSHARYRLAQCYELGDGVAVDHVAATRWYRLAADQGEAGARYRLGVKYVLGMGVERDEVRGKQLVERSADQGFPPAQHLLGRMMASGQRGYAIDLPRAIDLFERAAKQGHAGAAYELGMLYREGRGVAKDGARATALFTTAANAGSPDASWVLGFQHLRGEFVPRDDERALKLFRAAAEQCHAPSQWALGRIMSEQASSDEKLIEALMWLRLAEDAKYAQARATAAVVKAALSTEQVAVAEDQARAWIVAAQKKPECRPGLRP